jgi:LacI family transcriptional regulator
VSRPSIKDVAARAGVSLGTVSNVLNRPEAVRPATRQKVEEAIEALGFVRNDSARQLRAGVSRTIAYVVLDAGNPFFTDVARGVDEVAREHQLAVFLCDSGQDRAREDDYLDQLLEQRVRGLCITPVDGTNPRLKLLVDRGIPVVMVDRMPKGDEASWCTVGVDDELGGELAITHLLERGHTKIGFVGGPPSVPQAFDRLVGSRRAVEEHGLPVDALVVLETTALTVAEGRRAGARLIGLPRKRRPTAVFCANDLLALGFLQQMTQHGVHVPDDMAIVGYDDIEFAAAAAVPLTSVMQPRALLGRTAAELLIEEADSPTGHVHRHVQFEPELVVRRSSGG